MVEIVSFDKQGRLYVPKKLRERLQSGTVAISEQEKGLLVIPLDDDPFTALSKLGKKQLTGKSIDKLRKDTLDTTYEHATKKIRRH